MMRLMTVCAAFAVGVVLPLAAKPLDTAAVFASPTQEYGVNCWWWWLNGNTDKAAIAGDLAAMRDKGFQGAMVYDAGGWNDARTAQGCRGASRRGGPPCERRQRDRADRGPFCPGLILLKDQNHRAQTYKEYVRTSLEHPQIVGVHWHQFSDQATSGRFDGENMQVGWTDVCDTPYWETIDAAREIGGRMYEIRAGENSKVEEEESANIEAFDRNMAVAEVAAKS